MPLTSRQNVLTMSPELLQKIESANRTEEAPTQMSSGPSGIVSVLEKTLDHSKGMVLTRDSPQTKPNGHVVHAKIPVGDEGEKQPSVARSRPIEDHHVVFNLGDDDGCNIDDNDEIAFADSNDKTDDDIDKMGFSDNDDEIAFVDDGDETAFADDNDKNALVDDDSNDKTDDDIDKIGFSDTDDEIAFADDGDETAFADDNDKNALVDDDNDEIAFADDDDEITFADDGDEISVADDNEKLVFADEGSNENEFADDNNSGITFADDDDENTALVDDNIYDDKSDDEENYSYDDNNDEIEFADDEGGDVDDTSVDKISFVDETCSDKDNNVIDIPDGYPLVLIPDDDVSEQPDTSDESNNVGLFEVSVDISEHSDDQSDESNKRDSIIETVTPTGNRRNSRWSATVLFLASEVQVMVNLAHLNLPDGYEMAPKRNKKSDESDMSDKEQELELQPMDSKETNNDEPMKNPDTNIPTELSNGDVALCGYRDPPPNYDQLNRDDKDNDSLISNKSEKSDNDEDKENEEERSETSSVDSSADHPPHEDWGHKADYLLAVIGYAVDLSNVWRFPYLCYRNGGGAFIIPYFITLIFGALPIFFMEMCLGQYHREGPITLWKIAPMFKGIGYASCFMAYLVAFYYNVVIGWAFYYLFSSFTLDLPWRTCDHEWNSPRCWTLLDGQFNASNVTDPSNNHSVSSSFEFFERGMLKLHMSSGLSNLGEVRWELVLCTLLTFICIYFSLWKGVKSSGKVVYVTATLPYLILTILLIRGCLLPGAIDGIKYFITPNLERLNDPNVWIDAAVQIMFSMGCGFGTHIAYASHNKFNNNCYVDCMFTAAVNSFTSIFSGFVVFSYLGYMANRQQKHINHVAQEGPGLVFIIYPEAIATLPGSSAWAIIFFLMLITLGMDSAFGGLEAPLTGLADSFYKVFKSRYYREVLTLIVIGSAFLFSIPCNTWGGMYVFKILDTFAAGTSIVFTVLCQVVAVSWFYGIDQLCDDIHKMFNHMPGLYWRVCWKYLSPTFLLIIVISSILHYTPLLYEGSSHKYVYPGYANVLGWMIAVSSMSIIPLYIVYYILTSKGTLKERISFGISPKWEHKKIREVKEVKRFKREHWVYI
ncbi:Sodium-dependent noradrenaline transporter [Mactra antiquata]